MTQITTGPDGPRFDGMTVESLADDLHQMALRFADRGFSASSYMTMETAAAALRHLSARVKGSDERSAAAEIPPPHAPDYALPSG